MLSNYGLYEHKFEFKLQTKLVRIHQLIRMKCNKVQLIWNVHQSMTLKITKCLRKDSRMFRLESFRKLKDFAIPFLLSKLHLLTEIQLLCWDLRFHSHLLSLQIWSLLLIKLLLSKHSNLKKVEFLSVWNLKHPGLKRIQQLVVLSLQMRFWLLIQIWMSVTLLILKKKIVNVNNKRMTHVLQMQLKKNTVIVNLYS